MKKKPMYLHRSADGTPARIRHAYDAKFQATAAYRATLPDMMEASLTAIRGSRVPIQQVGIHNFRLPLNYRTKTGRKLTLETKIGRASCRERV